MFNRAAIKTRPHSDQVFKAPTRGWVQSGNIVSAPTDQAEVLDNIFPTAQSGRLRGGCSVHADIGDPIVRLFAYSSGPSEVLFAATATDIWDTSSLGAAALASQTSGDWSVTQIVTAGGSFLVGVNGVDTGWTFNGSTFSALSLTGIAEEDVSQIWLYKERLFFIEKGTMSAWYLPVKSIGGTAVEIPLGSVFRRGGSLLFGATWSLDTGSNIADACIFVTTNGEIAVYQGNDPSSSSTWALSGVYDIGKPIDKHAFFKAGGDLAIMTSDGIVPVSAALRKDRAALQADAITFPIEDAWANVIAQRTTEYPITATLWQSQTMLLVGVPGKNIAYVANARTGAWCRYTGWDVRCSAVADDQLYFGTNDGLVMKAESGGNDNGVAYTGAYVPKFSQCGYAGIKVANHGIVTIRSNSGNNFVLSAHSDYQVGTVTPSSALVSTDSSVWGTGVWGTFIWGGSNSLDVSTIARTVSAEGYSLSLGVYVTSNQTIRPFFEILATRLRFENATAI